MKNYIGSKIIKGEPMSEAAFTNKIKNEDYPSDKEDRPGYLVKYPGGYQSWSPKEVFEEAYREVSEEEISLLSEKDFDALPDAHPESGPETFDDERPSEIEEDGRGDTPEE